MVECTWNMSNLGQDTPAKKPHRRSAKVRIPMPDAYMYGLTGDVDDERDSDAERVAITVVSRITEMI